MDSQLKMLSIFDISTKKIFYFESKIVKLIRKRRIFNTELRPQPKKLFFNQIPIYTKIPKFSST